jgi:exosortase
MLERRTIATVVMPSAVLAGGLIWLFWPILGAMADRWARDPRYAHGYLVPLFSVAILVIRRNQIVGASPQASPVGLAFLLCGTAIFLVGGYFRLGSLEGLALLPFLAGITVLVGGWAALRWAWPAIAFLIFMIPLPYRVENALGPALQSLATWASTFALQTMGFMAFAEGNVIQLNDAKIGVVEACSGLSMVITFIALSVGMALVMKRPVLDRFVVVLSAIPVALVANIARIALTGVLHVTIGGSTADHFYHDLAGWVMIPFAVALYWCEIWILSHLLIEVERAPVLVGYSGARPFAAQRRPVSTSLRQGDPGD